MRIVAVSGGRADYGVLSPVLRELQITQGVELDIVATGNHTSAEYGYTIDAIRADGFHPFPVESLLSADTPTGIAKSIGLGTIALADEFLRLKPSAILLMGDRFELLSAAQAALVMRIPIVHLAGGDLTRGAYDDAIRHAITKMSHLHLVTNDRSRARVIQLGEHPNYVHTVGSPALDLLASMEFASINELERRVGFKPDRPNALVTYHATTLSSQSPEDELYPLLEAMDDLPSLNYIVTRPNQDNGSRRISKLIDSFAETRPNIIVHTTLGQRLYSSTMRYARVIVGNSSSGIYEAPFLKRPSVNIGLRQDGRDFADSIISCPPSRGAIADGIRRALSLDCSDVRSLYGDGNSGRRIVELIRHHVPRLAARIQKQFYDI